MFYSIEDLVAQAKEYPSVSELMIATEMAHGGYSRERIIETMEKNLAVMKQSVAEGIGRCYLSNRANWWRCNPLK